MLVACLCVSFSSPSLLCLPLRVVRVLLDFGADVEFRTSSGKTRYSNDCCNDNFYYDYAPANVLISLLPFVSQFNGSLL